MSDLISKKCDHCGKTKKETNGWSLMAYNEISGGVHLVHWDTMSSHNWGESKEYLLFDLCGQSCVLNQISRLLGRIGDVSGYNSSGPRTIRLEEVCAKKAGATE